MGKTKGSLSDLPADQCFVCDQKLSAGSGGWVGINIETTKYTLDDELATQGWFRIGSDCLRTLKNSGKLLEQKGDAQ